MASATCCGASSGVKWRAPAITSSVEPRNRFVQALSRPTVESRDPAVHRRSRRGRGDCRQSRGERGRINPGKSFDVRRRGVATVRSVERAQVEINRAIRSLRIAVAAHHVGAKHSRHHGRGKEARERRGSPRRAPRDRRPTIESHAVDETEMRHARRELRRDQLGDAATHSVTDDAGAIDPQLIEHLDDPLGVCLRVDAARSRPVAAAVAEQVEDNESVPGRNERE